MRSAYTHLVNIEVRYLQELVPVFGRLWDLNGQLQIIYWKVAKVLDLGEKQESELLERDPPKDKQV